MPRIVRTAHVPHTAPDMYRLVRDIEAYPEFLPWCSDTRVLEESETHQLATIAIAKSLGQSRFTTRNRLEPESAIHLALVDGPFRHLEGTWRFAPVGETGCRVALEIDFAFASRLFGTLMGPAFTRVCDSLVGAFTRRADALYAAPCESSDNAASS